MRVRIAGATYHVGLKKAIVAVFAVLLFVSSMGPIMALAWMSIMRDIELYAVPIHWIPQNPTLFNYANIFGLLSESEVAKVTTASGQGAMLRAGVINSLIVTAIAAPIATFMGSLAGYILGRYRFRYKNGLLVELMMVRIVPPMSVIVPYMIIFASWGLLGTRQGLIVSYLSSLVPLLTWVLMGFFATLPLETERAARVEGCGRWKAFYKVMVPIAAGNRCSTHTRFSNVLERVLVRIGSDCWKFGTDSAAEHTGTVHYSRV